MADIRECENVLSISLKNKEDYENLHAVLDYCMYAGIVFEFLQNKHGTSFVIVVGENWHLSEIVEICMGKRMEARICKNKAYRDTKR